MLEFSRRRQEEQIVQDIEEDVRQLTQEQADLQVSGLRLQIDTSGGIWMEWALCSHFVLGVHWALFNISLGMGWDECFKLGVLFSISLCWMYRLIWDKFLLTSIKPSFPRGKIVNNYLFNIMFIMQTWLNRKIGMFCSFFDWVLTSMEEIVTSVFSHAKHMLWSLIGVRISDHGQMVASFL